MLHKHMHSSYSIQANALQVYHTCLTWSCGVQGNAYRPNVVRIGSEEAPVSQRAKDVWVDVLIARYMDMDSTTWEHRQATASFGAPCFCRCMPSTRQCPPALCRKAPCLVSKLLSISWCCNPNILHAIIVLWLLPGGKSSLMHS